MNQGFKEYINQVYEVQSLKIFLINMHLQMLIYKNRIYGKSFKIRHSSRVWGRTHFFIGI